MQKDKYVLRNRDHEEIERLRFQHEAWKEETDILVDACHIKAGDILADLGGGPGWLALELAKRTGKKGKVFALDTSETFLSHVEKLGKEEQLPQLIPIKADLLDKWELPEKADVIVIRWVFFFLPNAEAILNSIVDQLKPGGRLAMMEYYRFKSMELFPNGIMFRAVYDAVYDLLVNAGGDPDIGTKIPGMLHRLNLNISHAENIIHAVSPGTPKWEWLSLNNPNHTNLVENKHLTEEELVKFYEEWENHEQMENAYFTTPPILRLVAVKPEAP